MTDQTSNEVPNAGNGVNPGADPLRAQPIQFLPDGGDADQRTAASLPISFIDAPVAAPGSPVAVPISDGRTETKLLIIGSGPAGLTAAIYAARANLEPIVLAGSTPGGQLMLTSDVENYPGFPDGIQGPDLMNLFRAQAERFGTQIVDVDIDRVDLSERPFRVWARGVEYRGQALIVATGASAMWLAPRSRERAPGRGGPGGGGGG